MFQISFLTQILIRILNKICKGTLMRVRDLIDGPDYFSCLARSS